MSYRKVSYLEQIWYIIKHWFRRKKQQIPVETKPLTGKYEILISNGEKWVSAGEVDFGVIENGK